MIRPLVVLESATLRASIVDLPLLCSMFLLSVSPASMRVHIQALAGTRVFDSFVPSNTNVVGWLALDK